MCYNFSWFGFTVNNFLPLLYLLINPDINLKIIVALMYIWVFVFYALHCGYFLFAVKFFKHYLYFLSIITLLVGLFVQNCSFINLFYDLFLSTQSYNTQKYYLIKNRHCWIFLSKMLLIFSSKTYENKIFDRNFRTIFCVPDLSSGLI